MKQKVIKDYSKEQTQNFVNTIISKHYACEKPSVKYIGGGSFGYVYKVEIPVSPYKLMLMYGKEASNRKQEIDRQHYTIPNQRPKDKHFEKI